MAFPLQNGKKRLMVLSSPPTWDDLGGSLPEWGAGGASSRTADSLGHVSLSTLGR